MQTDYRSDPNCGGQDLTEQKVGSYDDPADQGSLFTRPFPDQTWKSYDASADATQFAIIRDPALDAALKTNPPQDAVGFSPDLPRQLAWERDGGDGSPPA
jgi:hypothetical protein